MTIPAVYIIDDDPDMVELLCEVVELNGLPANGFNRATHFFREVKVIEPGAVMVLDLDMPEMDGIEAMRQLAKMPNPPALIVISGHDSGVLHATENLCRAHNLNILAALCKPLPLDVFRELLEEYNQGRTGIKAVKHQMGRESFTTVELLKAIHKEQLVLHYQPQIDIATGKLTGVEALVRWQHPEDELIYPDRFLPFTEENGLMQALTHWVIEQAVQQEQRWHNAGFPLAISVNVSASDITSLTLPEQLAEMLENKQLDPTRLTLEITESTLMGKLDTSLDILTRLRLKGIGLSIDDFGTGYSSLQQLHRAPFTELKIDKSFVAKLPTEKEARAIVKTCILLGHEMDMKVIAEGVENQEQLDCLAELGCDRAQGYFLGRPVPAEQIVALN